MSRYHKEVVPCGAKAIRAFGSRHRPRKVGEAETAPKNDTFYIKYPSSFTFLKNLSIFVDC